MRKYLLVILLTSFFFCWFMNATCACEDHPTRPLLTFEEPVLTGIHVLEIQTLLHSAGFYLQEPDGRYDKKTQEAVRHFQEAQGIIVSGTVSHETWDELALFYERSMAEAKKTGPKGKVSLEVDLNSHLLHVYDDDEIFKTYAIAVGTAKTPSPAGEFKIVHKDINWGTGFGTRWLGLNVPWGIYGIHGTNKPGSIGRAASHGCFRMHNRDVEELYPWVSVGTRVKVTGYTPGFKGFQRTMKMKMSGQDVVMLQYDLQKLGFFFDYADGRYGQATEFAVKLFEAWHMLPIDGEADMDMLARLVRYQKE